MLKVIGLVVVIAVIVLGLGPLQKWYTGDATPQETVNEIRQRVGESVAGEASQGGQASAPDAADPEQAGADEEEEDEDKPRTAEGLLKEMKQRK